MRITIVKLMFICLSIVFPSQVINCIITTVDHSQLETVTTMGGAVVTAQSILIFIIVVQGAITMLDGGIAIAVMRISTALTELAALIGKIFLVIIATSNTQK